MSRELTPHEVLVDLLGSGDFDHEILDPEAAARLIIEHLHDSDFAIVPAAAGAAVEMFTAIRAWFDVPRARRPSAEALGERIAAIGRSVP
jgi:hypothetical protein